MQFDSIKALEDFYHNEYIRLQKVLNEKKALELLDSGLLQSVVWSIEGQFRYGIRLEYKERDSDKFLAYVNMDQVLTIPVDDYFIKLGEHDGIVTLHDFRSPKDHDCRLSTIRLRDFVQKYELKVSLENIHGFLETRRRIVSDTEKEIDSFRELFGSSVVETTP